MVTKNVFSFLALENALVITAQDEINAQKSTDAKSFFLSPLAFSDRFLVVVADLAWLLAIIFLLINLKKITHPAKRHFLLFQLCLWTFSFLYFFAIGKSFRLFPRFFLPLAPLAVILFGLILERLRPEKNRWRRAFFFLAIILIGGSNLSELKKYFSDLQNPDDIKMPVATEDVFPAAPRATLDNQQQVVDYIVSKYHSDPAPVFFKAKPEFEPVFWYHLNKADIHYFERAQNIVPYQKAHYFLIQRKLSPKDANYVGNWVTRFDLKEKKSFGVFTVYYLQAKDIPGNLPCPSEADRKIDDETDKINRLYTWKKLFRNERPNEPISLEAPTEEELGN